MSEYDEPLLRRWLLHQLPEDQAQALEQRLFEDRELSGRVAEAETDLLDDFVRNRLGAADRTAVREHLLATSQDRDRLRFAEALAHHAARPAPIAPSNAPAAREHAVPVRRPRWPHRHRAIAWGGVAAACVAALVVAALVHRGGVPSGTAAQATITIALADPRRGASLTQVRIPPDTGRVRLQAEVDSDSPGTRYTLIIADGQRTLIRARNLVPRRAGPYRYVQLVMAARLLGSGERSVRVAKQGSTEATTIWSVDVATGGNRSGVSTRH
ncbi:MAG TPA: hypothetical protein VF292_16135 [Rhodanobacteraceae bacterium]